MDKKKKNLRNTQVWFKSYFKTSQISYLNNIGRQSFHSRIILTKNEYL